MAKAAESSDKDPSMEDILQSIKQIIADEGDAPAEAALSSAPAPAPANSEDILELTDMIQDDGSVVNVGGGGSDVLQEIDALSTVEMKQESPAASSAPAAPPVAPPKPAPVMETPRNAPSAEAPRVSPSDEGLISSPVASNTQDIIRDKLLSIPRRSAEPVLPLRDGITVEDLVIETLKPMLKEWLDSNLEHTVEQIVAKEIRRLMPND